MTTIVNNKSNIKKACLCLLILFLICKVNLQSQNLVVNGSFEDNSQNMKITCGSNYIEYNRLMNQNLCDLSCGSPDIFKEKSLNNTDCLFKHAKAYDGTVGIYIVNKEDAIREKEYNEHLILRLSEELINGRYYVLSFYANNSEIYYPNEIKMLTGKADGNERMKIEGMLFSEQNDGIQILQFIRTQNNHDNGYRKYECHFKCENNALTYLKIGFISQNDENAYFFETGQGINFEGYLICLLYTSPSPRDQRGSRMPSSA